MSRISWMIKNLCERPYILTETYGTSNSEFGTNKAIDNNLQTYFLSNGVNPGPGTVVSILFDMGSAVYADSLIVVHNMSAGTLFIGAGASIPIYGTADAFYGLPIYGNTGTSVNFLNNVVNYRYWKLFANDTSLIRINEVFIGRRDVFPVNPSYPFRKEIDASTIITESEKGQKQVYHKYTRRTWEFSYPSIDSATYGTFLKIRNHCGGNYRPFYFCEDIDANKFETVFCRFGRNSFQSTEISYNIYDLSFRIEEEL